MPNEFGLMIPDDQVDQARHFVGVLLYPNDNVECRSSGPERAWRWGHAARERSFSRRLAKRISWDLTQERMSSSGSMAVLISPFSQ